MALEEQIVLAIDVGSSSIRCSAYKLNIDNNKSLLVEALEDCCAKQEARTVQPNTGHIRLGPSSSSSISSVDDGNNNKSANNDDDATAMKTCLLDQIDACIDDTLTLLRQRSLRIHVPFTIDAIGFSTFVMNLIGVDQNGDVIGETASMSYACNSPEASEYCRKLKQELNQDYQDSLYQSTGAPLHSAYALVQLGAFYSNPHLHHLQDSVSRWQTIASICLSRWMGISAASHVLPISWSEASWTGLFNFTTCQYEPKAIRLLTDSCQRALPRVADFDGTSCSCITGDDHHDNIHDTTSVLLQRGIRQHRHTDGAVNPYWDRWPELRGSLSPSSATSTLGFHNGHGNDATVGCRLFLGLGDGACANIGSKCSDDSRIAVTIGTSAAARVCLPLAVEKTNRDPFVDSATSFAVPPGLFCYRINRSHILLGGALTDGGSVVEWVSQLTNLTTPQAFDCCMAKANDLLQNDYAKSISARTTGVATPSTANDVTGPVLTVVPFLSGERSTGFLNEATGAMLGLTRDTTAAHLLKACLEGVTLRIHAIVRLIQSALDKNSKLDQDTVQILTSGKALEVNHIWRQMLADCTGLNVIWDEEAQEGTSRGVALLLAESLSQSDLNATTTYSIPMEKLATCHVSKPNPAATQCYWKQAGERQDHLIGAVAPLF